ncbi:type I glutamate--ammonia ligase [Litorihabitans aurantiacus]|uniref:Glutamine synthetase n=1 Tax=Litorihabitans aurantiacus TaxID=1930061 RepID=A0AA38CNS9_9MICO|nr:type I glutamate--ammonia ligase [Litorihabitans aurantiacus]GMA31508.1 glutamine synthetase [Litorihabitans aurantiacus]
MFSSAEEAIAFTREQDVKFIDVRFIDLPGVQQHFNIPVEAFNDDAFSEGLMFDGSSIRGFQAIHESDMKLIPDVTSAFIDPFRAAKTLVVYFSVVNPFTDEPYSRDPRQIASKAEAYLKSTGIADTVFFGPEAEFYLFDDIRYTTAPQGSFYSIDSVEAAWNTGREEEGGNLGYKTRFKGGYFPLSPSDKFADLRDEMVTLLQQVGLEVERAHHEVGTAGQQEINYKFNTLRSAADDLMKFKYIIKNVAYNAGKTATFMPKPLFGDNGSGMHSHQSLWKDGKPLFHDESGYGGLSDLARWYIGGLLHHAPSLLAFTNPSVNSYRRLVPGFEAPVNLVYSARNRSACIRIPITGSSPKAKRVEFRVPDPSSNPYLAFSAMLMAGIDGIKKRIEPPEPVDKDLYELPPEEHAAIAQVPASLPAVLDRLEADHEYLTEGDVFTPDLIETWIDYKRTNEVQPVQLRPTPHEFELYYDV